MLTVNADDLGRCTVATDRILACFAANRINAASAMVFMQDSERAAALARSAGLDVGLHVNFTENLTGPNVPQQLRRGHERICKFLAAANTPCCFTTRFCGAPSEKYFKRKPKNSSGFMAGRLFA